MTSLSSIGHYRLTGRLGQGGMGTVYRATDTRLGREVAIKVLPESFAADPERFGRFTREAHVLASLNHPHIAAIYGIEERALILELVEGPTLAERISAGPIPPEEVFPLVEQLIDALEYAHENGVVHRDLKPANIKVTGPADGRAGTLKLLDFGVAKAAENVARAHGDPADSPTLTVAASFAGTILGTAGYMSPEQARGERIDQRADVWAFGAVLYEMLTGRRAFEGKSLTDTLAAVLKTDPDIDLVPEQFRMLVRRCLERDVHRRLGWIGDARFLLEPAPPSSSPSRRSVIAGGALVASLASAAGFFLSRRLPEAPPASRVPARPLRRITFGQVAISPAVSPNGKMVAYVSSTGGRAIWVQQVGTGSAIRAAEDPSFASQPVFSADGGSILFGSDRNPPGIYEVPVLGGEPRIVVEGRNLSPPRPSPDGKWIAYVSGGKLMLRSADGGEMREIGRGAGEFMPVKLAWSPDSRRILAIVGKNLGATSFTAYKVPIDGSTPEPTNVAETLVKRGFGDFNLARFHAWLPGDEIVFNARLGDANNLFRMSLTQGAEPSPVTLAPWNNNLADVRNHWVVFSNIRGASRVFRLPADLDRGKVLGDLQPLTPELVEVQFPDIREDGSALVYISRKFGGHGVFLLDLTTGAERSIVLSDRNAAYTTFSPDGSRVAFGYGGGDFPAYVVPAAGGTPRHVGNAGGRLRGWSRDGRFLLVWRPGKLDRIGVLELTAGRASDILMSADSSVMSPRLSPDSGKVAFVTSLDAHERVWIATFRGAQPVPEAEWIAIAADAGFPFWSPDGRSLYYVRSKDTHAEIFRRPLDSAGKPAAPAVFFQRIEGYLWSPLLNSISVTREGAFLVLGGGQSDVWLAELPR